MAFPLYKGPVLAERDPYAWDFSSIRVPFSLNETLMHGIFPL